MLPSVDEFPEPGHPLGTMLLQEPVNEPAILRTRETNTHPGSSASAPRLDLPGPRSHDLLDQCGGHRLPDREADRPFLDVEPSELVRDPLHHLAAGREEAAVLLERRE